MKRITGMSIGVYQVITRAPGSAALAHCGYMADR